MLRFVDLVKLERFSLLGLLRAEAAASDLVLHFLLLVRVLSVVQMLAAVSTGIALADHDADHWPEALI